MSIESRLREKAAETARILAINLPKLHRELEIALSELGDLNKKIEVAESALERAQTFESRVESRYQCPHCWIENHTRANLDAISADDNSVFKCASCGRIEKFYTIR